jgi:hypothetical protein
MPFDPAQLAFLGGVLSGGSQPGGDGRFAYPLGFGAQAGNALQGGLGAYAQTRQAQHQQLMGQLQTANLLQELTKKDLGQFVGTPDTGIVNISPTGEVKQVFSGTKPPTSRTIKRNGEEVTQQYDPQSMKWSDIAASPEWNPQDAAFRAAELAQGNQRLGIEAANAQASQGMKGIEADKIGFEKEMTLRKELENQPEVTLYKQAIAPVQSAFKTFSQNNRAADLDLVYAAGKVFDPGSVVREGEQVMIQNAQSLPNYLVGWISGLAGGGRLTPEARAQLLSVIKTRAGELRGNAMTRVNQYSELAKRYQIKPENIIPDLAELPQRPDGMVAPLSPAAPGPRAAVPPPSAGHVRNWDDLLPP